MTNNQYRAQNFYTHHAPTLGATALVSSIEHTAVDST